LTQSSEGHTPPGAFSNESTFPYLL